MNILTINTNRNFISWSKLIAHLILVGWLSAAHAQPQISIDNHQKAKNKRPCGEHTVAKINAYGKEFFFCVFEDNNGLTEAVFEYGSTGSVVQSFECAADLFDSLTDKPVPEVLERICDSQRRGSPVLLQEPTSTRQGASYCGSQSAQRFAGEQCWATWHNYALPWYGFPIKERCSNSPEDDLDWQCYEHDVAEGAPYGGIGYCWPYGHTWHQRTARTQLQTGADIRFGREVVASCDGTTVFEAYYKLSSSDHWIQALDFTMYHGGVGVWHFFNHPDNYYDLRFKANSYSGFHRYTGGFRIF